MTTIAVERNRGSDDVGQLLIEVHQRLIADITI